MAYSTLAGYSRSPVVTGTINEGSSLSTVIQLNRPYMEIVVRLPDCSGVRANTKLQAQMSALKNDALLTVYKPNNRGFNLLTLPQTGGVEFTLCHPCRRVRFSVSREVSAAVPIEVYGFIAIIAGEND